jgi:arginine N-succinyltransferase
MSFLLRSVEEKDLDDLMTLASQFYVMNLPPKKDSIREKISKSLESFAGKVKDRAGSEYLFVAEDTESGRVVGSSLIMGKHGTKESPHSYFKIERDERFSADLGIGFVHQVLKMQQDTNGPTEIGGLLVDSSYRRRPEKIGRQISMIRFIYMAMFPKKFEPRILCELTPPLTSEGRSEFWEAVGRRFTGLPYQEADLISQRHKEFITSLFPPSPIYISLLPAEARLVIGRVGETTKPAQHLLEKMGFKYLAEIDPFDGGPHFGVKLVDVPLVNQGQEVKVKFGGKAKFTSIGLIGYVEDGKFVGGQSPYDIQDKTARLPESTVELLKIEDGQKIFISPIG